MNREELFYLAPYLFSLILSLGIFVYTWQHRYVRGARVYSWFAGGQTLTILGFIFELVSPNLESKLLWDKFQWLTLIYLVIIPFVIFSVQFSEHKLRQPWLTWAYWLGIPILFTLLLLTDEIHHLLYPNPHLSATQPFPELQYDYTTVVYLFTLFYFYGANFYGISLLIIYALQAYNVHRFQYLTIAIGFLIPITLSILSIFNIYITAQRDISPFSFAIGNIVVAWGLFRYGLFDLVPIARARVLENMSDAIIVIDTSNRVVDVNETALKKIDKANDEVIGFSVQEVFAELPTLVKQIQDISNNNQEALRKVQLKDLIYELKISPVHDQRNQLIGRAVVLHDITKLNELEDGYRKLSEELEQRVREQTEELRNSVERYRAVVENQTEFIVRWKPDGIRTFANEAYCRYFGISYEEAVSSSFMPLIVEEDRPIVEEKISRLVSGETRVETFTHRVIKPDKSLGWQEWVDQAIYDETGTVIEIQSVGRDITERKQAEELINRQLVFDELLTRLLTDFATCTYDELNASINKALVEIAKYYNSEFAGINLLSEDKQSWNTTHSWMASSLKLNPAQNIESGKLSWTENKITRGETIIISSLEDYPPEAAPDRKFGESEGVKSLLSVPIRGREQSVVGAIDIASYSHQISWTDDDVAHLKLIGDAIANLLERKNAEENLVKAYDTTLEGWAKALELRDKETEGHSRRVTEITLTIAKAMNIPEIDLEHIRRGAILHDIGKMGIPDDILRKSGSLTEEERQLVLKHPITAYELLKPIAYLEKALDIPYSHHEKWDGTGYPRGLKGEEIPLSARIFAAADVWDALSYDRPYNKAWEREKIIEYFVEETGKHFDPHIVKIFLAMVEKGEI